MFLTIIAGVTIFVIGQFILKLILEPIVGLKETLGEVSSLFLREQSGFINDNVNKDVQNEVIRLSSMILAKKQAILLYSVFAKILRMPSESNLIEGCRSLNLISYLVIKNSSDTLQRKSHTREIYEEMKLVSKHLKIHITYSERIET
ncbi:hypothetical protein FQV37_409 [Psychrobacter nivimaris]|jgi:hypothetical protein|uniref:Uncharacterized protein n=1 Tax=Psychrobacter nivimaris TaxID=281738 RepID=A0A6N7BYY3_9GAMM|nr:MULTISPECIES: hypothetical protein [Psychrobacter]KAF0568905.1 hypothetical protein FQV37_409 [Psychrobacter nivimaris]KRG36910.1 hypothetical protein AK824_07440 [Psychrobacter sp. P11G3]MDN3446242.1 hypothetical protein [Psychrobacter sp. APC 3281]PKH80567.1 hypothetical protein CXF60_09315 [Psychrobacter sp. 4Bb]|tara:strand:+ start:336 stop:776 length:441 start_codon:yes stop_codon:yes gene_type:complete